MKKASLFLLILLIPIHTFAISLSLDTPKKRIVQLMGTPDSIKLGPIFDLWYYNDNNYLILYDKKLKGYSNNEDLNIQLVPKKKSKAQWLTPLSTPDDVITVLGTPRKITPGRLYEVWWYKNNFIKFLKNHIVEYSDGETLKFDFTHRKLPPRPKVLTEHSTEDQVIALKGTPTQYTKGVEYDTWWYNQDVLLMRAHEIHYFYNKPYQTPITPSQKPTADPIIDRLHYKGINRPKFAPAKIDTPLLEFRNLNDFEDEAI